VLIFAQFAPREAAGTAMAVVLCNAISGSVSFLRKGRVAVKTGLAFGAVGVPGAFIGAYIDQLLPKHVLSLIFGLFLLLMAARLFLGALQPDAADLREQKTRPGLALLLAFGAGFVASVFGVGGGIVYVPAMLYALRYPPHVATATSTFTIAFTALFATASHAYYKDIHYGAAVMLAIGAIIGAQIGVKLAGRIRPGPLVRLFATAVLLSGVYLLWRAFQ